MMTHFCHRIEILDGDVLRLILDELKGYLITLSTVSHFFRDLCKPIIFYHLDWKSVTYTTLTPPPEIWPYAQYA